MQLRNKNILLISPEPWEHIFVSKHHYAIHLVRRDNHVFFLNPPGKALSIQMTTQGVVCVNYKGFIKGLRYFPLLLQKQQIRKTYQQLENLCQVKFDVVWSFDNSVFYNFSALPENVVKISHIVDLNQDFQSAKAAATADICLGVCKPIVDRLRLNNTRTYFIPHGFSDPAENPIINLDRSDNLKIGYAGNLDLRYIDWKSIKQCIRENNSVQFYFAGPFSPENSAITWLKSQPNVTLTGMIRSESILSFYQQMDLLVLCYRSNDFPEQLSNSHKMMEYLASGKMVCATFTGEYETLQKENLIAMCQEEQSFPVLFKQVLSNLEVWNSVEKQKARNAFARDNTYDKQIARIETILNQKPDPGGRK